MLSESQSPNRIASRVRAELATDDEELVISSRGIAFKSQTKMNPKGFEFYEDDKENIDPVSGMRAGLAPRPVPRFQSYSADDTVEGASNPDKVAIARPGGNAAASTRILRDITPKPMSSEDEDEEESVSSSAPKISGDRSGKVMILEDENSVPVGYSCLKQSASDARKGKVITQVNLSAENAGSTRTQLKGEKKMKKRGLSRANGNIRRGIRSVR